MHPTASELRIGPLSTLLLLEICGSVLAQFEVPPSGPDIDPEGLYPGVSQLDRRLASEGTHTADTACMLRQLDTIWQMYRFDPKRLLEQGAHPLNKSRCRHQ